MQRTASEMIKVQREDFDVGREIAALSDGNHTVGGLAVFIGLVRDMAGDQPVGAMTPVPIRRYLSGYF